MQFLRNPWILGTLVAVASAAVTFRYVKNNPSVLNPAKKDLDPRTTLGVGSTSNGLNLLEAQRNSRSSALMAG